MNPKDLTRKYLDQVNLMQFATSLNNQPWVVTLHFYSDAEFNFYWISTVDRKHSQHIEQNPLVSATILVHENTLEEPYVLGITLSGKAELIGSDVSEEISAAYINKLDKTESLITDIKSGKSNRVEMTKEATLLELQKDLDAQKKNE